VTDQRKTAPVREQQIASELGIAIRTVKENRGRFNAEFEGWERTF
jgi:FixJ family two-component response regulator